MRLPVLVYFLFVAFTCKAQVTGVGINTVNPQQALHIAGTTGTIRLEGLNASNSVNNFGDVNADGDLTNDTFPLYINADGIFILDSSTFYTSEDNDAIAIEKTVTLNNNESEKTEEVYEFTVNTMRPSTLEIRYNLSFEVYEGVDKSEIQDFLARKISSYFKVDNIDRIYGIDSKSFTNLNPSILPSTNSGTQDLFFNVGSAYISLPNAGSYTIKIFGEVSSGNSHLDTSVVFGSGNDSLLYRIY